MSFNQPVHPVNSIFLDQDLCTNPGAGNNTFVFGFSRNVSTTNTSRMSVSNFSVPFSWFNITAALGNNKLGYVWYDATSTPGGTGFGFAPAGSRGHQYNFTIPDGHYSVKSLNSYLQFVMIQNGHYAIDQTTGNYVYFLEVVENTHIYRDMVQSYSAPISPPVNWTLGPGYNIVGPNTAFGQWPVPNLFLSDTDQNAKTTLFAYFGFDETGYTLSSPYPRFRYVPDIGTFPFGGYNNVTVTGDVPPYQSTVHSICLTCSYIDNPLRSTKQHEVSTFVVTTQNINVEFGNNVANSNFFSTWIPLLGGQTVQSMRFQLLDQEGDPIILEDPDSNIELLLTDLRYS